MIKLLSLLLLLIIVITGCSQESHNTPKLAAKKYVSLLLEEDWDGACRQVSKDSVDSLGEMSCDKHLRAAFSGTESYLEGMKISLVSRNQKEAAVSLGVVPDLIFLKRSNNGWQINFLPSAAFQSQTENALLQP